MDVEAPTPGGVEDTQLGGIPKVIEYTIDGVRFYVLKN
jgi:hypothetical protein